MIQLRERTVYGPIVDLYNSPQSNEVESQSAGTEPAPSVDGTPMDPTEEVPSVDGIAQVEPGQSSLQVGLRMVG